MDARIQLRDLTAPPSVAHGPNPTFRPGSDAAMRRPETGHSFIVQHFRWVKVSCADFADRLIVNTRTD